MNKIKAISIKLLFGLLLLLGNQQLMAQDYFIKNIHILSMEGDAVTKNKAIYISNGEIKAILEAEASSPEGAQEIDGKGYYIFPGLAEMHSHIPTTNTDDFSYIEDTMWLYLANGILNVRGMIGHASHLELKKKIATGQITGPRIFAAGPSLNGDTVENPESGAQMVKDQKSAGYDHLKLHPGLDMPRFLAISQTAKEVDIKFGGHVSLDVGLQNSLEHGYRSVEHMDGYIEALIDDRERLDPQVAGPFSMLLVNEGDKNRISELVALTKEKGAWIAPTLTLFERFFGYIPADEFRLEPEMKYMPGLQVQQWVNQKKMLESQGILKEENVKPYLEFREKMLLALHEGGVPLIMSSDSPQVFNVPGFSIHNEIKSMQAAGISPYEILKSGNVNVAKYFEMEDSFGKIKEGMSADFVMVPNNPLEDMDTLREVEGLMLRGNWITKNTLQNELKRIEEKNLRK
ncbi:amidohydrolase family protein [Mongoliibacter ruber]|uniref:Imidazolonepropionase-like amidohydrolase n=1 Tax=Mongoliibacter ruber TaxID=1750599 RepID=A0A2T0WF24_9BACT|nr:amidohydrolase family protein [Mongoliibacter ruber]PRY85309.1 imidazolonepropionase-like amidohydrolase [Mongoliibacter ruber]